MSQLAETTSDLIDPLDQRQSLVAQFARDSVEELVKFYSHKTRSFRRSLFPSPTDSDPQPFNTTSVMVVSAILNALTDFPRMYTDAKISTLKQLCDQSFLKQLEPRHAYAATSSEAFGDFNPLTSALLLKETLRRPNVVLLPPLTFRLALKIVLAYLDTQFTFDAPRMAILFGTKSMWSLPENHPMVMFRCVDAIAALSDFISQHSPGNEWTRSCFGALSSGDIRTVLAPVTKDHQPSVRRRLNWLSRDSLKRHQFPITREQRAKEFFSRVLDELSSWAPLMLDLEISKQRRKGRTEFDPSSLAGLLALIAVTSPTVTRVGVLEDLQVLFDDLDSRGTWPVGRPFFYDETGGAYHSVSIDIGYVALRTISALDRAQPRLSMNRVYDSFHDHVYNVYKWIEASRRSITVTDRVPLYSLDGTSIRQCRGWASDRSPGVDRIDGWMGAIVLDFMREDFALRKDYIHRLVFTHYQVTPYDSCEPTWVDLVDPDDGAFESVKTRIENKCLKADPASRCASILIYGPPGTSKTTIVRALARERRADLLQLSAGDFVQDSFELLENRARRIFKDLARLENVVVLFDEMDPLISGRKSRLKDLGTTIADYVIPGMLPKLQDFHDHCLRSNMIFVITTNFRDAVDRAASRSGRIDMECLVLPYTRRGRVSQLQRFLIKAIGPKDTSDRRWKQAINILADQSALMVYRDLQQVVSLVVEEYRRNGPRVLSKILGVEAVRRALAMRSVRLEEYSPKERPDSGPEFLCVLHRLVGLRLPAPDILNDMERLGRGFRRVRSRLLEHAEESELIKRAARLAQEWSDATAPPKKDRTK